MCLNERHRIEKIVRQKLSLYLGKNLLELDSDLPILEANEELDSITTIEILVEFEDEFGFDFEGEQLNGGILYSIKTVTDAIMYHINSLSMK